MRLSFIHVVRASLGLVAILLLTASRADAGAVRAGLDSNTFARNDDGSTLQSLGFTIDFFGTNYSQAYINNNGNITFDGSLNTFTPFDLSTTNRVIIAPFFADVDTRGPGDPVTYGQGTVNGNDAFAVNYINVAHYNQGGPLNSFQVVLIDRSDIGAGDFDIEFNYDQIVWESGQASGGDSAGLGGSAARVGYSNGSTDTFELAGSAVNGAFLDSGPLGTSLINNSLNSNVLGRYVFNVRNGSVLPEPVVPEPASLAIFGLGTLGLVAGGIRRRRRA